MINLDVFVFPLAHFLLFLPSIIHIILKINNTPSTNITQLTVTTKGPTSLQLLVSYQPSVLEQSSCRHHPLVSSTNLFLVMWTRQRSRKDPRAAIWALPIRIKMILWMGQISKWNLSKTKERIWMCQKVALGDQMGAWLYAIIWLSG